jgi:CBS domain containing-hemolysin-like protein
MSDGESGQKQRDALGHWMSWLRGLARGRSDQSLRESLEDAIQEADEAGVELDREERTMLRNILAFGELSVDDVMVPRADIEAVEVNLGLAELVAAFREAGHSRLPIYRESLDDIIGMVHVKDLLRFWGSDEEFSLARIKRPVLFVPPSLPLPDLLIRMQTQRVHMAIVVDEYGGTDGVVTIEDLVEEIVGEIEDEYDEAEAPLLVARPDGIWEADARTPIDDLERETHLNLVPEDVEEDIDTLGGLVFWLLGRVPSAGEEVVHPAGLVFEVAEADPRTVKRLRIRRAADLAGEPAA